MRRYHVNPKTGVPSICRSTKGKCPYGGDTGEKGHYDTYGEAQKASQVFYERIYEILPKNEKVDEIIEEIESKRNISSEEIEELKKGTPYEVSKKIITTENANLITGIIKGEVFSEEGWAKVGAALQNPHIDRKLLEDIIYDYPQDFNEDTRHWAVLNKSLTTEELQAIIEDENESIYMRAVAFRNPNLSSEYVKNIINNHSSKLEKMPYSMILYSNHRTQETDYLRDEITILRLKPAGEIEMAQGLAMKFVPFHMGYRKEIAEENNL